MGLFSQACPKCSEKKISDTDFEERFAPSMWFCGFKFENLQKSHDCKKSNSWLVI